MSIVVRYSPACLTKEAYDASTKRLEESDVPWPPEGLDMHVCFGDDGNLKVSEIWDSEEQWRAFAEQLMPALQEAGIQMSDQPQAFEVHELQKR